MNLQITTRKTFGPTKYPRVKVSDQQNSQENKFAPTKDPQRHDSAITKSSMLRDQRSLAQSFNLNNTRTKFLVLVLNVLETIPFKPYIVQKRNNGSLDHQHGTKIYKTQKSV